jgi:hypothetical protein
VEGGKTSFTSYFKSGFLVVSQGSPLPSSPGPRHLADLQQDFRGKVDDSLPSVKPIINPQPLSRESFQHLAAELSGRRGVELKDDRGGFLVKADEAAAVSGNLLILALVRCPDLRLLMPIALFQLVPEMVRFGPRLKAELCTVLAAA